MDFRIRTELPNDVAAVESVTIAAFALAAHADGNEYRIVTELRRVGALAVSLVAEDGKGIVIGHVAVSRVTIADGARDWYGLGPLSVVPVYQGHGIGGALVKAALGALRRMDAAGCVLVGDPAFYARFGFRNEPALVHPGLPAEYFQAIALAGTVPSGIVAYHESFAARA